MQIAGKKERPARMVKRGRGGGIESEGTSGWMAVFGQLPSALQVIEAGEL